MIYNYCRRLKWSIVLFLGGCSIGTLAQNSFTSNSNTSVDSSNGSLVASQNQTQERIFIAGVFDTVVFDWGFEIFNLTVSLLNNRTDGFHDDIFPDGTLIEFDVVNDDCDDTKATQAYWSLRNGTSIVDDSGSNEMHGVVGSRCSGASIAIARIAALEGIPQVSPVSTSARLSDDNEYPFFSRMVAPGNANGEVGALIALLRNFDWTRVAILNMDTQYAKDIAASFRDLWEGEELNGEVSYSNTINLVASTGLVDEASVRQVLDEAPTGDPTVNSRIVVLLAQEEHAFPILKVAKDMGFQEDTIWIGVSWIGRDSPISTEWLSGFPGYLGIAPYENRNSDARDYLERVQQAQLAQGRTPWTELPHYAIAYTVDAILALATALSQVPSSDRRDGIAVTQQLRNLTYDGISGHVAFTENGDRAAPQYSLWNYQMGPEGTYDWIDVGSVGSELGSVSLTNGICFAQVGCNIEERMVPKDRYPVPRVRVPAWVTVLLLLFVVALFAVGIKYWHQRASHKATVEELQSKLSNLDDEVDAAVAKRNRLILERGNMMDKPDTWSDSDKVLVEVLPSEDQYWHVTNLLRETMNDAYVTKIWRVQNSALWSYYSFHKHRLAINGIDNNEAAVWHGTSNLDPSVIYCDQQDGFMMQYSRDGYWGRGIYFADKSSYSNSYSYKPAFRPQHLTIEDGRPVGSGDEHELFLTKLLIGKQVHMNRDESSQKANECRALTVPPVNPRSSLKYNTVAGETGGSKVWIVYENGRAYPDYLVRYYRGKRDPKRTPYQNQTDALNKERTFGRQSGIASSSLNTEINLTRDFVDADSTGSGGVGVIWEFWDNSGWKDYNAAHQRKLEAGYKLFSAMGTGTGSANTNTQCIHIQSDTWFYRVDLKEMKQTNIENQSKTQRDVRRRIVSSPSLATVSADDTCC